MTNSDFNEMGYKAYLDGVDLFNSPSYLNPIEQEAWRNGYEKAMHEETIEFIKEGWVDDDEPSIGNLDLDIDLELE